MTYLWIACMIGFWGGAGVWASKSNITKILSFIIIILLYTILVIIATENNFGVTSS